MTNLATTSLIDRANLDRDAVRREIARGLEGADATRAIQWLMARVVRAIEDDGPAAE